MKVFFSKLARTHDFPSGSVGLIFFDFFVQETEKTVLCVFWGNRAWIFPSRSLWTVRPWLPIFQSLFLHLSFPPPKKNGVHSISQIFLFFPCSAFFGGKEDDERRTAFTLDCSWSNLSATTLMMSKRDFFPPLLFPVKRMIDFPLSFEKDPFQNTYYVFPRSCQNVKYVIRPFSENVFWQKIGLQNIFFQQ